MYAFTMKFTTGNINLQQLLADYDCFLLDFDGTLYNETDYLFPAYQKTAAYLASKYPANENLIAAYLIDSFTEKGRGNLFNALCLEFQIPESEIPALLEILRTNQTAAPIPLFKKMQWLTGELIKAGKQIFVVTNGNVVQQKNKVSLVNWQGLDKYLTFVYTAEHKPKPDSAAFTFIQQHYGVKPDKSVMIGDTVTDEEFAANSGIAFIHVSNFEPLNELA